MNIRWIATCSLAVIAALLLWRTHQDRSRLQAELDATRSANEAIKAQLNELTKNQLSKPELDRLIADQRDAIRLRGEVASLKQSLAQAQRLSTPKPTAAIPGSTRPALDLAPLPEDNPAVRVHKASLSTEIPAGHSLLLGGWETEPGKRTFALLDATPDSTGAINVATRWLMLSEEAAQQLALANSIDTTGQQFTTFPRPTAQQLIKQAQEQTGVDLLTSPSVSTLSGRQAQIAVTESRGTPDGPVEIGPRFDILPTLSPGGKIQVDIQASITLPREP